LEKLAGLMRNGQRLRDGDYNKLVEKLTAVCIQQQQPQLQVIISCSFFS